MKASVAFAFALAVCIPSAGCTYILGFQKDYVVGGGDGGAGGAGGSSASGSGASGIGGAASTGPGAGGGAGGAGSGAGSATTSSTSTSTSTSASSGAGGGPLSCPTGFGPTMVDAGGYCIDTTEVTNAQYAAFLATAPDPAAQPSYCAFNTSFVPSSGWPAAPGLSDRPVVYVGWCDARAFCAASGKRLCGQVGGGPLATASFADPSMSQWTRACSNAGAHPYPYGSSYAGGACDGSGFAHKHAAIDVGSAPACHGDASLDAVFDMSGNVAEWEDSCAAESGANDACRARGGSFDDDPGALGCYDDASAPATRATRSKTIGFRCCAD
jgi:hypothetical protein